MNNTLSNILQYPIQFKLNQTKKATQCIPNQTQNTYFEECDSFNQNPKNHYSFKKSNDIINQDQIKNSTDKHPQKQILNRKTNFDNSQKYSPNKVQTPKSNLYICYKINQISKNVPEFQFRCKIQQGRSNQTSPNFKQSLIKIQQSQSPLKKPQGTQHPQQSHNLSYQNEQSINPFKKSSQFKNKKQKISQIKQNKKTENQTDKKSRINNNAIDSKRLFFQNQDTFEELLKKESNQKYPQYNYNNRQSLSQSSLVIDDLQNQNMFTPYKVSPIRNQYLADRSISSLEREFQRDLDRFASFSSKPLVTCQSQSTITRYKPFRPIIQYTYQLPIIQTDPNVQQACKDVLNSQNSTKDKDGIFFLTNINYRKQQRRMNTEPIQQFHFNLSNIINQENSYINQNCSQTKEGYEQNSSKVKLKNLIYEFVDQLDCLPDYQVSSQLIQDLQSVMNQIVSKQQVSSKNWQKIRMNTQQSTSSDFKIFKNSIMKDKTNKLNEQKNRERRKYMKGTISSSAKSLQYKQYKQTGKTQNKQNFKETRIRGKNQVYMKGQLDSNRTKKSITPRKLF